MIKKSNRIKRWQLNVTVLYNSSIIADSYRSNILELLRRLASIYRLDYAISVDHPFSCDCDSIQENILDIFYFKSNENSRLEKKELQKTIDYMFYRVPSSYSEGIDIQPQPYKLLKNFPFPTDFYRPLSYPLIEHHTGLRKRLLSFNDYLQKLSEDEQDYNLN